MSLSKKIKMTDLCLQACKTALLKHSGRGLGLPSHLSALLEPKLPPNRKGLILINLSHTATIQLCYSTLYRIFVKLKVAYVSTYSSLLSNFESNI